MNKAGKCKGKLNSFDDLFVCSAGIDQRRYLFQSFMSSKDTLLQDDEKMQETVESIKNYGVLMPGIARPRYRVYENTRRGSAESMAVSLQVFPQCLCLSEITTMMKKSYGDYGGYQYPEGRGTSQVKKQKPIP